MTPLTEGAHWRALLSAVSAVFTLAAAPALAGPAQDGLPDPADPCAKYLFYRADPVWLDPLLDWLVEDQTAQGRS